MAQRHAEEFQKIEGVELVACADIHLPVAQKFAKKNNIPQAFSSLEGLLAFAEFDAVANVTPDRFHCATTLPLLTSGKHVLCEKPLAENHADALKMAETAQQAGVINMVNFSYRNASAIHKAHELIQAGKLGHIMHVEASYLQEAGWSARLGGIGRKRTSGSGDSPPSMEARAPWETLVSTFLTLRPIRSVLCQAFTVHSRPSQMSRHTNGRVYAGC